MDAKEKKILYIRVGAGAFMVLLLIVAGYLLFAPEEQVDETPSNLGPSDLMIPSDPAAVELTGAGTIIANPTSIEFSGEEKTKSFTLLASQTPIVIEGALIATEFADQFTAENIDCPISPNPLEAGQSCNVSITWTGTTTVSTTIQISGSSINGGTPEPVEITIPINAIGTGEVSDAATDGLPTQNGQPVPADNTSPTPVDQQVAQPQQPQGPSIQEQRRNAYLNSRRQTQLSGFGPPQLSPSAKSAYSSWNNIGAQGTVSSFPTDMSRVITPDKPITAVLAFPIDTRQAVTAVAMVDRDIYGGNGRTVVIPRGSRLIGQISASTDRVGVAWSQLIRPDGVRFVFEGQSGDASGRGGIPGRINERLLRRYGFTLIPPAIAAGVTAALGGNNTSNIDNGGITQQRDARSVAAEILTQPLNQITQDIVQRNSQIPTQITVAAGTRITVWSVADLRLKPVGEKDTEEQTETNRRSFTERQEVDLDGEDNQNGTNGFGNGGGNRNAPQQTVPALERNRIEGSTDINTFPVGTIDANGNFVPRGTSAPVPNRTPLSQTPAQRAQNPFRN